MTSMMAPSIEGRLRRSGLVDVALGEQCIRLVAHAFEHLRVLEHRVDECAEGVGHGIETGHERSGEAQDQIAGRDEVRVTRMRLHDVIDQVAPRRIA